MVYFSQASFGNLKWAGFQAGLLVLYVISLVVKKAKESSQKYLNFKTLVLQKAIEVIL